MQNNRIKLIGENETGNGNGGKMENMENDYLMSSIDEYFALLDEENQMRSRMVAKSLAKYLKKAQPVTKFDKLIEAQAK